MCPRSVLTQSFNMERWANKVAVVTGASAGIGAAVCEQLVEHGVKVVGIARREDRVNALAEKLKGKPGKLYGYKCDISNTDEIPAAFQWIKDNVGPVEILINNAGIWRPGMLMDGNIEEWKNVLNTNVLGLCVCTKYAIAQMKEIESSGYIINVNSMAGHTVYAGNPPATAMYSPSKFAVTCLTEVLHKELLFNKSNIRVTSLSPGVVKTEIAEAAGFTGAFSDMPHLLSEDIADTVTYLLSTPQRVHIKELIIAPTGQQIL